MFALRMLGVVVLALACFLYPFGAKFATSLAGIFAKGYCSGHFVSKLPMDAMDKFEFEGWAPYVCTHEVDEDRGLVRVSVLGRTALARFQSKALGCALVDSEEPPFHIPEIPEASSSTQEQIGFFGDPSICSEKERLSNDQIRRLQDLFTAEVHRGKTSHEHTRALALIHCGQLVAEGYADKLDVDVNTPLPGWSMTKSVMSLLVGARMAEGKMSLEDMVDLNLDGANEEELSISNLVHMVDGLAFQEVYGYTNDPSLMLFTAGDTARFAREKGISNRPGSRWCYNSGSTNVLSAQLRNSFDSHEEYLRYPWKKLYHPLGAVNTVIEPDKGGHFVGSSFGFASARDWAKLGQLVLQNGTWKGEPLIPSDFIKDFIFKRVPHSGGVYTAGWWTPPPANAEELLQSIDDGETDLSCAKRYVRERNWTRAFPDNALMASGYLDQNLVILPTHKAVFIRLGYKWPWREEFVRDLMEILNENHS